MEDVLSDHINQPELPELPPVGLEVLVQCQGFRCLARRTSDGKWKSAYTNEELSDVLFVVANT